MSTVSRIIYHLERDGAADDEWVVLSGWIFARSPYRCEGVRGWINGRSWEASYGLWRPDVAAEHPLEDTAIYSGFQLDIAPWGQGTLNLHWLDAAGKWHPFAKCNRPEGPARTNELSVPTLSENQQASLFDIWANELSGETWRNVRGVMKDWADRVSCPITPASEDQNLELHLDDPTDGSFNKRNITLTGWVTSRMVPIKRLSVRTEPVGEVHLAFPITRPDVEAAFPEIPVGQSGGFQGMVHFRQPPPVCVRLRFYAELAGERIVLVGTRRLFVRRQPSPWRMSWWKVYGVVNRSYQPVSWPRWLRSLGTAIWPSFKTQLALPAQPAVQCRSVFTGKKFRSAQGNEDEAGPLISLLVPVFNPPESYLRELIESVLAQSYANWELCAADDASTKAHVRRMLNSYAKKDQRIRLTFRETNGHIPAATNTALAQSQGDFVALVDHDDLLPPDALSHVAEAILKHPEAVFFYTDRDKIDDTGRHFDQERRGGWNPAMAATHNYLHHLTVVARDLVQRAGALRPGYQGAQDLDLYLRCHELLEAKQIVYVPVVGYHWRAHAGSTASRGDQKDYTFDSARRAIEDAMRRRSWPARPFLPSFGPIYGMNLHQLRWSPEVLKENPVSIVVAATSSHRIPQGYSWASLKETLPAGQAQLIVVQAGENDIGPLPEAREGVDVCKGGGIEAGLAELFNRGAKLAKHEAVLFLDAGLVPGIDGWLEDMSGWLSLPDVAVVGPKLVTANGCLVSAGWTTDPCRKTPLPMCEGMATNFLDPPFLSQSSRDAWLLDPRCVLTKMATFRALGGFDFQSYPSRNFVADYCLRVRAQGQRCVYSPQAVMEVRESARVAGLPNATDEDLVFLGHHPNAIDPWVVPPGRTPMGMPREARQFPGGWFHLEQPETGQEIQSGHQILAGWCMADSCEAIADLRVKVGGQLWAAEYGHPRPDLTTLVRDTRDAIVPAGFVLELALPKGRARLEFEALGSGGNWQPVALVDLVIRGELASTRPQPETSVTWDHYRKSLDLLVQRRAVHSHVPLNQLAGQFANRVVRHRNRREPLGSFHGWLDQPEPDAVPLYHELNVWGWLFHESRSIHRLLASFNLIDFVELEANRCEPTVPAAYDVRPGSPGFGIFGTLPVPANLPRPLILRIWAELDDGQWHLVFVVHVQAHAGELVAPSIIHGVSTRALVKAAWALGHAYRRQSYLSPGWLKIAEAVRVVRSQFPIPASPSPKSGPTDCLTTKKVPLLCLVSHNLNREGAPMFLLELARFLHPKTSARITVVSPSDGSLRNEFEQLGIEVFLVDRAHLWTASTKEEVTRAVSQLGAQMGVGDVSLIVANTIESFWAVEVARSAGIPSLFYVHEPGVLGRHYLSEVSAPVRRLAVLALAQATRVSFLNRATRSYYETFSDGRNYCIQPGWTDHSPGLLTSASRRHLRTKMGYASTERIVINVGTVCPRKGQWFFVQAIEQLWRMQPEVAASCRFLMIGSHHGAYGRALGKEVERLGRPNLHLVPPTKQIRNYYGAADLFVISSFEEGFSRVLLEAMSFGLPIINTDIHGLAEIARPGKEAHLVRAADTPAMTAALLRLLTDPIYAKDLGQRALQRLEATFVSSRVLPRHWDTLKELAPDLAVAQPALSRLPSSDSTQAAL